MRAGQHSRNDGTNRFRRSGGYSSWKEEEEGGGRKRRKRRELEMMEEPWKD